MRISDWSSDVCSSDLNRTALAAAAEKAFELGYHARVLGTEAVGPAEDLAVYLVKEALDYQGERPACLLLGGERDRKSVVEGKCVSVRVDLGGRRIINQKT